MDPDLSWLRPYLLYSAVLLGYRLWNFCHQSRDMAILANKINESNYDLVHVDQYPYCRAVRILPHLTIPTVVYSHEPSPVRYLTVDCRGKELKKSRIKKFYSLMSEGVHYIADLLLDRHDIRVTNRAQAVLVNSQFSKEAFFQRYGRLATVCHYGVDYHTFCPLSLQVEPMVVSIGRLVNVKQHHLAIEAVGMIDETSRPRMVIATPESLAHIKDREYSTAIEKLAKDKGVALDIWYRPSQHDLARLYNQAIALIFVPIMEPFGLVAIEAMACGTPVIGVKEAGIRESVLDGLNGVLVDRTPGEIAAAIIRLMNDSSLRAAMSAQAVKYVRQRWTWQQAADCYEVAVQRLLNGQQVG